MKQCTKCKTCLPLEEFFKDKKAKDGHCWECKKCYVKRAKIFIKNNPKRVKKSNKNSARKSMLKNRYGITLGQYDRMFEQQNGVCAICSGTNPDGRRLAVDHNHKTGRVRELLCLKCNGQLSGIEDKGYLKKAIKYLRKHNDIRGLAN